MPAEPLRLAAPPIEQPPAQVGIISVLFPVVGGIGMLGFALAYGSSTFLYIALAMIVVLLVFSIGMRASQKRATRKRTVAEARRYAGYLRERDAELARAGERQRGALARLYPDAQHLWTQLVKRRDVWERRPHDRDFLHIRLGEGTVALDRPVELDLGMNPLADYHKDSLREARRLIERRARLRSEPVTVDLADAGVLAVTGERSRARAWARGLMVQLAASRAPHDLRILTCFPPEHSAEWEWGKWLPHQRVDPGAPAAGELLMVHSPAQLEALLERELRPRADHLRRLQDADPHARRGFELAAPELVVIVDGWAPTGGDGPAFKELLARARTLKAVLVLLVDGRDLEPSHIAARLSVPERGPGAWEVWGLNAPSIPEVRLDEVDLGIAEAIARTLAPLRLAEDGGDGERGLGASVRLVELLGAPDVRALEPARAPRPRAEALRAPIGRTAQGEVLWLDLKQAAEEGMGPHGVLVGATGSGKSELLRSLVAGLAATHDPQQLAFVLVDYKGGAAFAELARLPHVAGMITNLSSDLSLVDRMRDALIGEQERRQTMLREAGNVDDIVAYQALRERDPALAPLPDLLVIVDEFAELLATRPDFIDLFVGLGRVGRSLGIHLLLASQRLDEGRLRGLESHLRYRICLRTYSAVESKLVLGTPDAYLLPSLPGLGYLKVDTERYEQFRAALSSAPVGEDVAVAAPPPVVQVFDPAASAPPPAAVTPAAAGDRTELQALVDRLAEGREPVHQVWVAPLPAAEPLDAVLTEPPFWRGANAGLKGTLGRLDRPGEQRTEPYVLDLTGAGGHVAIVGAPRTGKSTALRTLAAALILRHSPRRLQLYAIDLGGGLLAPLAAAPHVGGVAGKLDREAIPRAVAQLAALIEDREALFRERGWEGMRDAREAPDGVPDVVLLVDGWETFKREFEGLDRQVEELAAAGLSFGVHVAVAANRWAEIRPALLDNLGSRLELRLNDAIDSLVSRAAASALPADVAGRGLTPDGLHVQVALPRVDGVADDAGAGEALGLIARRAAEHWDGPRAEPIRLLPRVLAPDDLPPASQAGVPIGVEERGLEPVRVDLFAADPHLLVFGDAETGKSSLIRLLARGLAATAGPRELRLTVVDVRRSLADLAELPHVQAYAANPLAAQDAAHALAAELLPRLSQGGDTPRHVVLFDDYDLSAGPASGPLAPLLDLVAVGRDVGLHIVLTRRVGGSARGAYEPVFGRLRELGSPGLLLSGDPAEGPLLGSVKAAPQPPGRGLLVRRGERPLRVQTAFTPAGYPVHPPPGDRVR